MKIKAVPVVLSLGIIALSGCQSSEDQFYTDATNVMNIVNQDYANGKHFSPDQLKQVNQFINKYADLKMGTQQFSDYMKTIGEVEDLSNSLRK